MPYMSPKIRKEEGIANGPTTSRHSARMLTEPIKVQLNLIAHVHSYLIASIGIPHIPLLCLLYSKLISRPYFRISFQIFLHRGSGDETRKGLVHFVMWKTSRVVENMEDS